MANGGIIGPVNTPTTDVATGVWEQEEQYQARVGGIWPPIPAIALNSCRFDDGSSDNLSATQASGNRRTWTFSTWVKRCTTGSSQVLINARTTDEDRIQFHSSDIFRFYFNGAASYKLYTDRVFRDTSAWYHVVVAVDTTQGTDSNRVKIYFNGVQETSFSTEVYPSQNYDTFFNTSNTFNIGTAYGGGEYMDGYMSETIFVDGLQLTPTSFGELDANGFWKPIIPAVSAYGTNGFRLKYEDASSLGTDSSPNGNNLTVNNLTSIDQTTDYPVNNFATFNPLFPSDGTTAFSEGNLKLVSSGTNGGGVSSVGVSKGKYYIEVKQTAVNEPLGNGESLICVVGDPAATKGTIDNYEGRAFAYGIRNYNGTKFANTSGSTSWHGDWTAGDIISIALDMDSNNVYFAKNGQYADGSGNWDEAFTGSPAAVALSTDKTFYFIGVGHSHGSATETFEVNFGSPSFTISSGNTDDNGYGNFEYAPPSGFLALNTANLSEVNS